ncbi:hypothetical protein H920_07386 [Fukomys damarensis]|uniref:Uncharacterized protein n=1 Tax=Fukomys damarensis TaxID=885580 RepID=A0A091DLT0_FUKDA|nr:hypothetical protein H920_07386 [Fukomys damarensis]
MGVILYEMVTGTRLCHGDLSKIMEIIIYGIVLSLTRTSSLNTKHFIRKLTTRDHSMQPTAQKVLEHQWIQGVRLPRPPKPLPVLAKSNSKPYVRDGF